MFARSMALSLGRLPKAFPWHILALIQHLPETHGKVLFFV